MNVSELRVGNLVNKDGAVHRIGPDDFRTAHLFKHIPLTEKRLLRLGFKQVEANRWQLSKFHGFEIMRAVGGGFSAVRYIGEGSYYVVNVSLVSVHKLQNLFYAFEDRELTIM